MIRAANVPLPSPPVLGGEGRKVAASPHPRCRANPQIRKSHVPSDRHASCDLTARFASSEKPSLNRWMLSAKSPMGCSLF